MTYNEAKTLYEHAPFQALWKSYNKKEKKNKVHREHYFGLQYRLQFRVIGLLCTYNFQKEIYIYRTKMTEMMDTLKRFINS